MSNVLPQEGSVLGVDVGFSKRRKSSAVCRLDWTETNITWSVQTFGSGDAERRNTLLQTAGDRQLIAAALDGPLAPGFQQIGKYRLAEQILTRDLWRRIGKPGQSSAPVGKLLNDAANECALVIKNYARIAPAQHFVRIDQSAIAEAFPSSFLGLMIDHPEMIKTERGNRSDLYFERLIDNGKLTTLMATLLPGRQISGIFQAVKNHDERAAVVSSITALCIAMNNYTAVGDGDGWIILPPRTFIEPHAFSMLEENARSAGGLYVA